MRPAVVHVAKRRLETKGHLKCNAHSCFRYFRKTESPSHYFFVKKKKQLQSFNFNSGGSYFLVWVVGRDLRPKNIISLILKRANRYVGRSPRETTRNQNLACLTCDQS